MRATMAPEEEGEEDEETPQSEEGRAGETATEGRERGGEEEEDEEEEEEEEEEECDDDAEDDIEDEEDEYGEEFDDEAAAEPKTFTRLTTHPSILTCPPKPYQLEGLNWLIQLHERGMNGVLADEMDELENLPDQVDVVVTSYEMCILEKAQFMKVDWEYVVIDEAHRIKNETSKLAQTVRLFSTQHRLLLTGTPLQNNLRELWALLNFLFPSLFASSAEFEQLFDLTGTAAPAGGGEGTGPAALTVEEREQRNMEIVTRLHRILRPFMLRRVKKEVLKEMPPKKELLLFVPLSEQTSPANTYCRIDGNTSGDDRDRQIEAFNAPDSDIPIFLLSTRAGGLGINLATADTVILYDSDWNPQVDLQAMDRVHRIGQKSAVNVYRLVHEHTIEEKIIEKATLKLQLDTAIIQQGRLSDQQNQQKQLSKNELMSMVQFGADHIFKSGSDNDLTEEDLEAILARYARSSPHTQAPALPSRLSVVFFVVVYVHRSLACCGVLSPPRCRGQARTNTMNEKLQTHVKKSLLDFTINASASSNLYEYDGVDYTEQQRKADREAWAALAIEALEAQNDRESRRRQRLLLKEQEQRQQQQQQAETKKLRHIPRAVRLPPMQVSSANAFSSSNSRVCEWQFYSRQRIEELHAAELLYYRTQGSSKPPTDEEREEKRRLLQEGFGNWGKRDFIQFVR
ncbi:UNVERIFIED_CONTAM: hypothetical protein H355_012357 [Colinus virginianus]|nr:hypothetical protein H355_012357 [Colinus virginianus]